MAISDSSKKLHQSRKGITLTDGFFLALNPRTQKVNVISISGDIVYIHDITRKISLEQLVNMDRTNYLDIFESLKLTTIPIIKNKKG